MKLYDYLELMKEYDELTVWDDTYFMETYFYSEHIFEENSELDSWDKSMGELAKLLTIKEIREHGVVVNLTELVENKMKELEQAKLFIHCDIDSIMCDMDNILAGYVSESWMEKFVNILKG